MKTVPQITTQQAAALVKDGDTLLQGGFGMTGNPVHLMDALSKTETKNITFIGNNVGEAGIGGGRLLRNGQLKKMIGSFFDEKLHQEQNELYLLRELLGIEMLPKEELMKSKFLSNA